MNDPFLLCFEDEKDKNYKYYFCVNGDTYTDIIMNRLAHKI
jgi:hypothetical protein